MVISSSYVNVYQRVMDDMGVLFALWTIIPPGFPLIRQNSFAKSVRLQRQCWKMLKAHVKSYLQKQTQDLRSQWGKSICVIEASGLLRLAEYDMWNSIDLSHGHVVLCFTSSRLNMTINDTVQYRTIAWFCQHATQHHLTSMSILLNASLCCLANISLNVA